MSFFNKLFDTTMIGLQKAMDLTWKRNQAIASNIANAETPQYRAIDFNFGKELEKAFKLNDLENNNIPLKKTNSHHLNIENLNSAHFVYDDSGLTKPDGNNVDIDIQMGKLITNSGNYSQAAQLITKKLLILRNAIRFMR